MKFLKQLAALWLIVPFIALAIGQVGGQPLVVPGSELGWEAAQLELVLRVAERTPLKLSVYSLGFDPNDYRSPNELGDERYDGGKGDLKTLLEIYDVNGAVRLRKELGNEPHRWRQLVNGVLSPGDYLIKIKFFGNGKNALAFKLDGDPSKVTLQVAPGAMQTYNVHGPKWVYPFALEKRDWTAPLVVGIYDGDGPEELQVRVRRPDGKEEPLPSPPNGGWVKYPIDRGGVYKFGFRQPEGAKQFTNTVGFEIFLGEVEVEITDEQGRPVEGATYKITGYYDRTVQLTHVPEGWAHVRTTSTYGKELARDKVLFGPGGGKVHFVLRPRAGSVVVKARTVCSDTSVPAPIELLLGERSVKLNPQGAASVQLPAGRYPVAVRVPGARVQAPGELVVGSGGAAQLDIQLEPVLELRLDVEPAEAIVGDEVRVHALLETAYPHPLPAELRLSSPAGLSFSGNPGIKGYVSADHPLRLDVTARAEAAGSYELRAQSIPCAAEAKASLLVRKPAAFSVTKQALTPEVVLGETARFRIEVSNSGERAGTVRLKDVLPAGLQGKDIDTSFTLEPGAARVFDLTARVTAASGQERVNTAVIYDAAGKELDRAQARIKVLVPDVQLSRTLDKHVVVPGEEVKVCLQVKNSGPSPLRYELHDSAPDLLDPAFVPQFHGELESGAQQEHCYPATVRFGPEASGVFSAQLNSNAGGRTADDTIRRVPLGLEKKVKPELVILGEPTEFTVTVVNPTDHELTVRLQEAPASELGMKPAVKTITLAAGGRSELHYEALPTTAGRHTNQASAFVNDRPAAFPAKAAVEVRPQLKARRVSRVRLPFEVDGQGDGLLIAHRPPEGSRYRLGSSRLDGVPVEEPRQTGDGRLIWKLPFAKKGTLSYELEHEDALPPLPEPALTLLAGDRELPLKGEVHERDYQQARPLQVQQREGMIREPLPGSVVRGSDSVKVHIVAPYGTKVKLLINGELVGSDRLGEATYDAGKGQQELRYYGVPLAVGANRIEVQAGDSRDAVEIFRAGRPVQLVATPVKTVADGRTPLRVRIEARDEAGLASGMGFVTIAASPEPRTPDANPNESGYQVLLRDGVAEIELEPMVQPGDARLRMAKDELEYESSFFVPGNKRPFWLAQGSVTARYGGSFELGGIGRYYAELPIGAGTLQTAIGASASMDSGGTHYRPDLGTQEDPNQRFPLTGSGTEARMPLVSDDGVAFRYDQKDFSAGYHRTALRLPGISGLPNTTALYAHTRGAVQVGGFMALLPSTEVSETIIPDGTRAYFLSGPAEPGSESVELVVGSRVTKLVALRDYVLDGPSGVITLARPLWPTDRNLEPVSLRVTYAPATAARDVLAFGAGAGFENGPFRFGVAAATLDRGVNWKFGAEAAYRTPGFRASVSYSRDGASQVVGLNVSGTSRRLEASGNLRYDGSLRGRIRLAGRISAHDAIVFEHRGAAGDNRSDVLFEHRINRVMGGLGVGYAWERAAVEAVGRIGYTGERAQATFTHRHSFSTAPSLSVVAASYAFDFNLKAEAELAHTWGIGTSGTLALKQNLGPANLAVSYQLPGAGGAGNRARFGIDAPLPLGEHTTLDLNAGYERSLSTSDQQVAAGIGLRYHTKSFSATAGVEGATGTKGGKLTFRTGATGQIDDRQTISFDANYVLANQTRGRFTLAYALRARTLQFLTYHRLVHATDTTIEGELAPVWHPNLKFQLRPSAAYRVAFSDPAASLYQLGLGANYYFTPRLGVGAGAFMLWQPGLPATRTAFNVEGSLRVIDPLWLNLGYTFGGFYGLTPEARPGIYIRLDFFSADGYRGNE